jgi:hypothetical protein
MLRKQALFAVFAVGLLVVGIDALAYRAYGPGGTLVHVAIRNYSFRPGDLAVRMGTTVRWVNMDPPTEWSWETPGGIARGGEGRASRS